MPAKKLNKKISIKKAVAAARSKPRKKTARVIAKAPVARRRKMHPLAYFYWLAILAFVGTTCYMLQKYDKAYNASVVMGEPLAAENLDEYAESGKQKLLDGDAAGALNDFSIAIERNPAPINFVFRGEVLMQGANFDAAVMDFDSALRIDPAYAVAYYDRALAHIKQDKLAEAKSDLDNAVRATESQPNGQLIGAKDIYAKRAQLNLWQGAWADAESDWTSAISSSAGRADWNDYAGRAESRTNLGNYSGAVQDYLAAITIISDRLRETTDEKSQENMSRQAMQYFEASGALNVKLGQRERAGDDLRAAQEIARALGDEDTATRLQKLIDELSPVAKPAPLNETSGGIRVITEPQTKCERTPSGSIVCARRF